MQSVYSKMNFDDFEEEDYQRYLTPSSTASNYPRYGYGGEPGSDIELDDTAPLPLLVGMGVTVFLGAIILILICCCCRRKRPLLASSGGSTVAGVAGAATYQRAPVTDGGAAYPMTQMTGVTGVPQYGQQQNNYGVIGQGGSMSPVPPMQPVYPGGQQSQSQPHFGGVPTFPVPNQYLSSPAHPSSHPSHPSHLPPAPGASATSSQASTVSGATADPLVPPQSSQTQSTQQQQSYQPYYYNQQIQSQQMSHAGAGGQPMRSVAGVPGAGQGDMLPPPPGLQYLPFNFPSMTEHSAARSAPSPPPYPHTTAGNPAAGTPEQL